LQETAEAKRGNANEVDEAAASANVHLIARCRKWRRVIARLNLTAISSPVSVVVSELAGIERSSLLDLGRRECERGRHRRREKREQTVEMIRGVGDSLLGDASERIDDVEIRTNRSAPELARVFLVVVLVGLPRARRVGLGALRSIRARN
jgi:hypothetical protein